MSSRKTIVFMVMVVLLVICVITSCANLRGEADNAQSNGGYQDDELMDRIAKDYEEYYYQQWGIRTSFEVEYFYGVYDECAYVMMVGEDICTTQANRDIEVGGVMFHYRDGNSIEVWRDGEFYSLEEAYEQGYVTVESLQEVAKIQNKERYEKIKE